MDLATILIILEENTSGGTLTLPPEALESTPIEDAFREYLLDADLVVQQVSIVPVGGQNITVVGQGASFPFENCYITAVFTAPASVAAMTIEADGLPTQTSTWGFEVAFPSLSSTFVPDLEFTKAVLTLRSANASLTQPTGLSFNGKQELTGPLAVVGNLLNGSSEVALSGPITIVGEQTPPAAVPVMVLEDPFPGDAFGLEFIFQLIDVSRVVEERPPDVGASLKPLPTMRLVSRIRVDTTQGGEEVLDIIAHFTPTFALLTFQADMDQALVVSQAALNLLARGANLGSVLPTQLPLVNRFTLGQWSMSVLPQVPQISSLSMGAGIAEPWTVIPGFFTLEKIDFAFTITNVDGKFEPTAALTAELKILEGPAQFTLIVDAQYPSYVISGFLEEESTINLIALVQYFLGNTIAASLPCTNLQVTVLTLLIDPRNSTFTLDTVVTSDCSFPLGIATFILTEIAFNFSYVAGNATGSFQAAFWLVPPEPLVAMENWIADDPPEGAVAMQVSAAYNGEEEGWSFRGGLAEGGKIDLRAIVGLYLPKQYQDFVPNVVITTLEAGFETGESKAYDFSIGAEWTIGVLNAKIGGLIKISSVEEEGLRKDSGEIQGFLRFGGNGDEGGLELKVTQEFDDENKNYTIEFLGWTVKLNSSATDTKLTFDAGDKTLGEMIEVLINAVVPGADIKLTAPWSVLNSFSLKSFKFVVEFDEDSSAKSASLTYSPKINLGFAQIDEIALEYQVETERVMFKITKGRFLNEIIGEDNPLEWDVKDPETTPEVPGEGSELFRLSFLGLGQHMAVADATSGALEPVPASIFGAITQLNDAFTEKNNRMLKFNEATDWLIATRFTVIQAVELGIVFYDPELYGLVISVTGSKAAEKLPVFNGLVFEILYKKINDTVGMWQIDLTLPFYIRNLQFGAVSVTLPSLKLQIYTNGNFLVDLGFPANDDFSRSFSLQMLPFVGSGGFYFGVLSSETSKAVPKTTNGNFSPVIAFGLGLRVGLGKDLDYGMLKAGLSLTVQGVLEGVLAWYNPYPKSLSSGSRQMVGRGQNAAAASGDAFYYMIQARVSLVGKIYGEVDFGIISGTLDIEVRVSVRVTLEAYRAIEVFFTASLSLTLKIRINLGLFKITIRLSFKMTLSLGFTVGNNQIPPWGQTALLRQTAFVRRLDAASDEECSAIPVMKWQPLLNDKPGLIPLLFVPQFTAATDGPLGVGSPRKSYVVAMTYVPSSPPKVSPTSPAPFDNVASGALLWTLNAYLNSSKDNTTLEQLLEQDITIVQLKEIYCYLTQQNLVEPFTEAEVLDFLKHFFIFHVTIPPVVPLAGQVVLDEEDVSVFPIMPLLKLTTSTGVDVDFLTQTPASTTYLSEVKIYFEQMAVRYKTASEKQNQQSLKQSAELNDKSLASFIFMDFFAMLARSTIQDAISLLETQQAPLAENESLADFVTRRSDLAIDVPSLALANATKPLRAGVRLRVPGVVYTVKRGDTVQSVAAKLNHDVVALRHANPTLGAQLPQPASELRLPAVTFTTSSSEPESLLDITRRYDVSISELALANQDVAELFPANEPLLAPHAQQENIAKLVSLLQHNGSFNNLSGLAARVLLQGLRPPSPKESPQEGNPAPLYELTGQQFDGSDLVADSTITLSVDEETSEWFGLGADGDSLTYIVTEDTAKILTALKTALFGPEVKFEPAKLLRVEPRRFTLPTSVLWSTPDKVTLINRGGDQLADTVEPRLWQFPSELMQIITGPQALQPKVELWTQRQEGPGQEYPREPVKNYTWSTVLEINLRQTASGDGVFLPNTYEMTGLDAGSSRLLENLLVWYANGEAPTIEKIRILYPPNPAVEDQTEPPTGLKSDYDPMFFLLQNNLSTASQPPQLSVSTAVQLAAFSPQRDPLGQKDIEFLKLLWESSIVNSGGYVLYYEAEPKKGLPNYLFSQDGVATLTLLVTYLITDNVLQNYLNNVVINQVIDTENEVLYASPVPQTVSNFQLSPDESLADVARRFRVTVSQLATHADNAHAKLATGKHLRVPSLIYRVRAGESLETIAAQRNVTRQALVALNKGAKAKDLSKVRYLRLPETVWRANGGDSLASLAERFSSTVETLAHANKDVPGLIEGPLQFDDQLEEAIALIPPGNVAFHFTRPGAVSNSPDIDAMKQLAELYNLLSYRIENENGFEETNPALPISPTTPEGTNDWIYDSVVPVYPFATPSADPNDSTPPPKDDPYNGVGNTAPLNFYWQDLFGNWIDSDFNNPDWPDKGFPIGYIDNLIALDQWPSVTSDYVIALNGSPELSVALRFNAALYLPSEGSDPDAIQEMALTDLGKFQLIYYQLTQPDVNVTLSSMMQTVVPFENSPADVMVQFVLAIINFLTPISAGAPAPPAPADVAMSQPVADGNTKNIFALVVQLEIRRNPDLINDQFRDVPAVRMVSSRVPANAGHDDSTLLQAEPQPPLSLQEFARQLETAFPALKVLVAAPKQSLGQAAEEIWIARLAPTATGIAFNIDGQDPSFFAAAPLAGSLLSRPDVLVYPYRSGKYIANEIPILTSQNSIDLDQMGRDFLSAVEEVLGPQFSAATWKLEYEAGGFNPPITDPPNPQDFPYEAIIAAKESLADAISNHVINVFETIGPSDGLADAREMFRQQLLINLTAAFTVDVIMQYPVEITHSEYPGDDLLAPQLFGKPVADNPDDPNDVEKKDAFSFSTGKFSLAKRATGTHLTFSFDTNREQQGKDGKQFDDVFTIDLFHQINALEHEIHPVQGIDGYLASSWLSFVLPDSFDTPGERKLLIPLGKQTIPVPLRAYPTPPSLSEQTFVPRVKQFVGDDDLLRADGKDKLLQARLWDYRCQYEYVGAAHDKILANVKLNVPPSGMLQAQFADADNPDLFASLVQFTAVYPAIAKDLDQYLVKGTDPDIARNAISSFAWLVQRTAKAWLTWQTDRLLHSAGLPESPEYHFVIAQRAEDIGGVAALVVSVTGDGSLVGLPKLPRVDIAGYTTRELSQAGETVSYYFEQNNQVLTYDIGRNLSSRQLVFSDFDILKIENAWAGAAVKRNENLLPDKVTNPEFVFQSPVVRFVNVLTPLLDPDEEIDIADFTTLTSAPLAKYLSDFLIAFFEGAQTISNENRTIQLAAAYGYGLQDATTADAGLMPDLSVRIPILLTTPTSISILKAQLSPESPYINAVAETINDWFANNGPTGIKESGRLWFDLSVYSSLSETQLPVLRMRRLYLETKLLLLP